MLEIGGNLLKNTELGLLTRDERLRRGIPWLFTESGLVIPRGYAADYERAAKEASERVAEEAAAGFVRVTPFPESHQLADDGQPLDERTVRVALSGTWLQQQPGLGETFGRLWPQ